MITYDAPSNRLWGVSDNISKLCRGLSSAFIIDVASRNSNSASECVNIFTDIFVDQCLLINKYRANEVYKDFELLTAWNLNLIKRIKEFYHINKTKPSIVHCHSWLVMIASKKISSFYKVPLVYTAHFLEKQYLGLPVIPTMVDFDNIVSLENDFFSSANAIITFGKKYKTFLVDNYRNVKSKISIIPHGVEIENNYYPKENNILFVGRLVEEKGIYIFLETAKKLRHLNYEFIVIGTGPLEQVLKQKYNYENIIFKGKLNEHALNNEYYKSKIYCSTSYIETFALTKVEAALAKNVIITTEGPRIEEIFPKDIIFSITPGKSEELVNVLLKLARSKKLILDRSNSTYNYAICNYSIELLLLKTKNLYMKLLGL